MVTVLVTGCNGFIGRYVCAELKAKNYNVIGLSREQTHVFNVDKYIQADVTADDLQNCVTEQIDSCDVIVHTAAKISSDNFDKELISVNCIGAGNIVHLAQKLHCKKIINTSGAPIIGRPLVHPITEEHPIAPLSLYHITKVAQEHIFNLAEQVGILAINVRISSPIGVGMNSKTILPVFLHQCLNNQPLTIVGKGNRKQNYIDVRDVALGIEKCISVEAAHACYNITSDKTISNLDLAKQCIEWTNSKSEIVFNNKPDKEDDVVWDFSIAKAEKELGFVPEYTLHDSVLTILQNWENLN